MINIEELYKERDDIIRSMYDRIFPKAKYTIWDGVFSPLDYAFNPFRVLFMNREPYDSEFISYNVVHTIHKQIIKGESFWSNQTWLKKNIRDMLAIFSLMKDRDISQLSDNQIEKQINSFRKSDFLFEKTLLESAYINIKKSDGKSQSDPKDLRKYAQQGLKVLKAQISFFNPSVIVGGNIVDEILENIVDWEDNLFLNPNVINVYQLKVGNNIYPFIDSFHLSAISYGSDKTSMDKYYVCLAEALKTVAKHYPNYWEKRRNLPIFNQDI